MTEYAPYPPVVLPGTCHALRHLPFVPASLKGEFHALAAFHLNQAETQEDAEMILFSYAILNGWRCIDHLVVYKFFKECS